MAIREPLVPQTEPVDHRFEAPKSTLALDGILKPLTLSLVSDTLTEALHDPVIVAAVSSRKRHETRIASNTIEILREALDRIVELVRQDDDLARLTVNVRRPLSRNPIDLENDLCKADR